MGRAKRNASADFAKKKTKLGKRRIADNVTDTTITKRQVTISNQVRTQQPGKTGLSVQHLLSRTHHHNHNTRIAALNALTNAITDPKASAHVLRTAPTPVVTTAANALADPVPRVRTAALTLLIRLLRHLNPIPFRPLVSAPVLAALSHIRIPVRVHAARALILLVRLPASSGPSFFTQSPLVSLSQLLADCHHSPHQRVVVLDAVAAFCHPDQQYIHSSLSSSDHTDAHTTIKPAHHTISVNNRFYYHRPSEPSETHASHPANPHHIPSSLIVRVADAVTEDLAVWASRQVEGRVLISGARALASVIRNGIPTDSRKPIIRSLTVWKRNALAGPPEAQHALARVALALDQHPLAVRHLCDALQKGAYGDALDDVVRHALSCPPVARAWVERFETAVRACDASFIRRARYTILDALRSETSIVSAVLKQICAAIEALSSNDAELACRLLRAACAVWRTCPAVVPQLVRICENELVMCAVGDVVGVAHAAGVLVQDDTVAVIGRYAAGRPAVAYKFLPAIEWLARRDDRAVALASALARVHNSDAVVVSCARRIAAACG